MGSDHHIQNSAAPDGGESHRREVSSRLGVLWQVRTWIVGGLFLALTPIAVYDIWQLKSEETVRIHEAKIQLHNMAGRVRQKTAELIDDAREVLLAMSQIPSVRGADKNNCNNTLRRIGHQYTKYTNFSVVDEEMFITCSSGKLTKPVNVRKSPNIQQAFATGKFATSPFKLGVLTGKPILVFSMPIKDAADKVVGTVNNGLDLSWLSSYIADLQVPAETAITVFASDGRVVAHHPSGALVPGDNISDQPLFKAFQSGADSFALPNGREALFGVTSLINVPGGIHFAAYVPSAPLHEAVQQELFQRLFVLFAILVGAAAVVLLSAQAILIQPLKQLMNTADDLASGNMGGRTGIRSDFGEVGHLAACFDRMADSLEQREDSLRKTIGILGQSNAELERFAYVASHDLQEPLRTVISYTQMLNRRIGDKLDAETQEYMDFVTGGAHRMRDLVSDLLDYSRVGTRISPLAQVDMVKLSRTVLLNLEDAIRESEATVTVADDLPNVCGDSLQLGLVLQNLIGNAIKYHRPDRKPVISVTACETDECNLFKVTDNGIGIDPQFYDSVFEAFKRLHGPDVYQGTGIGLAIVKRIVERHRGKIWIEEAPGGGAVFCFTLPLLAAGGCRQETDFTPEI